MPFTFSLPTTSDISYTKFFLSCTHPSLIVTATTQRAAVRSVLKKHKRLPAQSQSYNLSIVLSALEEYVPYLFAIDAGLGGKKVNEEEIDITLLAEFAVEWRTAALAATIIPGRREASRPKGRGLDYEICFVLSSLAYVATLLAQSQLRALYASTTPTPEQRTGIITKATRYLLQANSIHSYLIKRAEETVSSSAMETSSPGQEALAELALAEATLLAVLKDDPYPAVVAQDRNMNDNEWKYKAPEIPKVRAHLFARLCLAAAGHATKADLMLSSAISRREIRVDERLTKYINDLRRTAKAKAYRLFGIDAELGGETGQAIAWLLASKKELGFAVTQEGSSKMKGLAKLKNQWTERKEDRKIEKGGEWGGDAGRFEEARIVDMLEKKWNKINDTVRAISSHTQISLFCFNFHSHILLTPHPISGARSTRKSFHPPIPCWPKHPLDETCTRPSSLCLRV